MEYIETGPRDLAFQKQRSRGAGSPQAQRVLIGRLANVEEKKAYTKSLAFNNSLEAVEAAIRAGLKNVRAPGRDKVEKPAPEPSTVS